MQRCFHKIVRALFMPVLLAFPATATFAQVILTPLKLTVEQDSQLRDVLAKALQQTKKVGCPKVNCKILVLDFTDSKGNTSTLGMRLADRVSADTAFPMNQTQTIDRDRLRAYLEKERIPSHFFQDSKSQVWLARELSADAVLLGRISPAANNLDIQIQLAGRGRPFDLEAGRSKAEKTSISYVASPEDLASAEPFGDMPEVVINGETIRKFAAGGKGENAKMTVPVCTYHPDPPYSESARSAKYQGVVILQTVISEDGRMVDVRPLKGAPYGLNRISIDTVRTWRCNPATVNGQPINVVVPVEISFRLF